MPIYEFYCPDCHTIFNFLARRPDTSSQPDCPRCGRARLDREISRFAISKGRAEPAGEDDPLANVDDAQMEQAFEQLARESEGMDEDDPRQMARMMRKLHETTGLQLGQNMEEAIRRLEAGEDPDAIEEEMGDVLEDEDPFVAEGPSKFRRLAHRMKPPNVDETLYEL